MNEGEKTEKTKYADFNAVVCKTTKSDRGQSPVSAWRYVTFVPSVPTIPKSNGQIERKSSGEGDINFGKEIEKIGTVGTNLAARAKRECGKCAKFRKSTYPACSFPHGIAANGPHCDYAENCRDFENKEEDLP